MEIVKAAEKHIDEIVEIEKAEFSLPWSKKSFLSELEDENVIFLAAEDGEQTIGFGILHYYNDEGEIYNIAVSSAYRRQGIGDKLLSELLKMAGNLGVNTIFLDVRESNLPARNLYKKYGFYDINIRKGYYDQPKEDAVIMIRIKA